MLRTLLGWLGNSKTTEEPSAALFASEVMGTTFVPDAIENEIGLDCVFGLIEEEKVHQLDWRDGVEELSEELGLAFEKAAVKPLTESELQQLKATFEYPAKEPLVELLEASDLIAQSRSKRLLSIDTNSDQYCFVLADPQFYQRWVNIRLSEQVCTQSHYSGGGKKPVSWQPREI